MSIFKEIPVTAGFPLKARDIASAFNVKRSTKSLEEDFKNYLGVSYAKVTYSGTAALYLISESIKKITKKRTILIPSYICTLVPLAIKRAGFNMEICDITGNDFNYNIEELEAICSKNNDIAAILAVHMAGTPVEFETIERIAKKYNAFIIEDCALSLGASYKDRKTGTLGDFSFFSLCRGKGVTMYEGGVIAVDKEEYSKIIDETIEELVRPDFVSEGLKVMELFGYGIFYRPSLFWFAYKLPTIFWDAIGRPFKAGGEEYDMDFSMYRVSAIRKRIGHSMFNRLDEEIEKQREKALYYIKELKRMRGITVITEPVYAKSTYPYVIILFDDYGKSKNIKENLFNLGLGISDIYSKPINEYNFLKTILPARILPNARRIAQSNATLTTSTFMKKEYIDMVLDALAHRDKHYPCRY